MDLFTAWFGALWWAWFWISRAPRQWNLVPQAPNAVDAAPLVSVVLAARNEESRVLRDAIQSILGQNYPNLEVLAVDDRSTDRTLEILNELASRDRRLKVLRAKDPVVGWSGKTQALRQAVRRARGEWVLATDADILFAPEAVATAVQAAANLDVLSLWPRIDCESFWERLLIPVDLAVTEALFPLHRVNSSKGLLRNYR